MALTGCGARLANVEILETPEARPLLIDPRLCAAMPPRVAWPGDDEAAVVKPATREEAQALDHLLRYVGRLERREARLERRAEIAMAMCEGG